jgi:GNAT superfamily N-acetyltransferase
MSALPLTVPQQHPTPVDRSHVETPIVSDDRLALVTSRPMRDDDGERILRLFDRLSPETRYRRFFSPITKLDERMLADLVGVDHEQREAFVALVDDEIIGVARYDRRHDDPATAEIAVVVEDAWQGKGVGRYLMKRLGVEADRRGITRLTADVLPSNEAPVKLARAVAPMVEVTFSGGETHLNIPLRTRPRRPRDVPGASASPTAIPLPVTYGRSATS